MPFNFYEVFNWLRVVLIGSEAKQPSYVWKKCDSIIALSLMLLVLFMIPFVFFTCLFISSSELFVQISYV